MSNSQSKKAGKFIKKYSIGIKPLVYFGSFFLGLFGISQVVDYINTTCNTTINFTSFISKPLLVYIYIAIIAALIRFIIEILTSEDEVVTKENIESENDSLIEMLKEAEKHSRWAEIIKLGSALSDFLWYTSRKKLRCAIGHFVEVAATQLHDDKTLAETLIEDIGNTTMVLGHPDDGIRSINKGIKIAQKHNYYYLVARGFRNLANSYAMKNDLTKSREYLNSATENAELITDEAEKLEILGGIEYARCKTEEHSSNYDQAIAALDASISYYDELSRKYPVTNEMNKDRVVKVYREKGHVLIKKGDYDEALTALYEGLKRAQETLNHENIVRCCTLIVKIKLNSDLSRDPGEIYSIEGMLSLAKQHIDKTDIPGVRKDFNDVSRKYEVEKESIKKNESE